MARLEVLEQNAAARSSLTNSIDACAITDLPKSDEVAFVYFLRNTAAKTFVSSDGRKSYWNCTQAAPPKNPPSDFARVYGFTLGQPYQQDWLEQVTAHEALFLAQKA